MSVDLSTWYLGMKLRNPVGVSASPLTANVDMLRRLEDAGAAVAVMPSLFEEQIEHEEVELNHLFEYYSESFAEATNHFPLMTDYNTGPGDYLRTLEEAKQAVSIPVIASLNGSSFGGWVRYAKMMESAGADAIELNVYFVPTDPNVTARDVEQRYIDLVSAVRQSVAVPLTVKIGPNFTALPNFAQELIAAGAEGLVMFNRYLEADIDLETMQAKPDLILSNRHEARVPIRWIAILRDQLSASIAATSGVHRMQGAIKLLLAGADVTMVASVLMMKGPEFLRVLIDDITNWLEEHEYESVEQMKGSMSHGNSPDPSAFERANYMKALTRYTKQHPVPGV